MEVTAEQVTNELCRRLYSEYVETVHEGRYKHGAWTRYLCSEVQKFVEMPTGNSMDILVVSVPPQHGKALEISTPVLTTNGWKNHGDLIVGDYVYGQDGKAKKVLEVQTPYLHHSMVVRLDTGEEIICAREHEWIIEVDAGVKIKHKSIGRQTKTIETQNIFKGYNQKAPAIKVANPLQNEDKELPIPPYVLGIWLGDGTSASSELTTGMQDCEHFEQYGSSKLRKNGTCKTIRLDYLSIPLLRKMNLYKNKHIPVEYLTASYDQRLELFKGMMDTDGCVNVNRGMCEYCGINKQLCEDFNVLCRSLGFKAIVKEYDAKLYSRFISKKYRSTFVPDKGQEVFGLNRKQERINQKTTKDRNDKKLYFIRAVDECEDQMVSCITVEGGLYLVGKGLIPTHNSMSITETLPSWYVGKNPDAKVIMISYNDEFATKFCRRNRDKVETYGKRIFNGGIGSKASANEFELKAGAGVVISRGALSGVTGNGANLMIIDDPIKTREEAESENHRNKIWDEWLNSWQTRLAPNAKVILIMTRWHLDDLAGRILKSGNSVREINFPVECITERDILGRTYGDALFPEIGRDNKWLADFKKGFTTSEGNRAWTALYMGRPTNEEGGIFKRHWFKYYDVLPRIMFLTVSVDANFKDKETSDPVAIQVWGKSGVDHYLIERVNRIMGFVDTLVEMDRILTTYSKYNVCYVEDKANGSAIIEMLRRRYRAIVAIEPEGGKVARAYAVSPMFESGNIYIKKEHKDFENELCDFPYGKHDDDVDACTQDLNQTRNIPANLPAEKDPYSRSIEDEMNSVMDFI